MSPRKNRNGEVVFKDYPEFRPNLTPREIFGLGSFGGTYWRPIHSSVTNLTYENEYKRYPKYWWKSIPKYYLVTPWEQYDKSINFYQVRVGSTLEDWEKARWIHPDHPYGWVQWYCDFYAGYRSEDDDRQIARWKRTAGPNSRFRRALINMIRQKNSEFNDYSISPKIRQTLQHWGYRLTEKDYHL